MRLKRRQAHCFKTTLFLHEDIALDAAQAAIIPEVMALTDLEQRILEHCTNVPALKSEILAGIKSIYKEEEIRSAIESLVRRKMLEAKESKFWFIILSTVYVTSTLGTESLRTSY